jgi:GntR family transcriptional regulator/MocR family aminotransferase
MSLARRMILLDWARQSGAWILEDDYDSEYRFRGRPLEALRALDHEGGCSILAPLAKCSFPRCAWVTWSRLLN